MKLHLRLPRGPISSSTLILGTSLFVAAACNIPFFAAAHQAYGSSAASIAFIASLYAFITSIFVLVLSAVCHRRAVKPLLIAFVCLSSVLAYFTGKYGTIFDYRMIANVMDTDTAEARDLLSPQLAAYILVLGLLPSLLIARVMLRAPHWKVETLSRLKLAGGALAALATLQLTLGGSYAALVREHAEILGKVTPTFPLYSAVKLAVRSAPSATAMAHAVIGADAKTPPTDEHRELVIMVVGETSRADHWSLNGYRQETNPLLARQDVINFPDFWSCGTSTSVSVPCMFSGTGRARFDTEQAKSRDNALDILKRAGVSVLWRDNNSDSKGVALRVTYEDYKSAKTNPVCDAVECRDEGMLRGLQTYIDAQKGDVLIVLHQMGNHGPAYYKRYPKAFERFTPVCRTNDLGACSQEEVANAYDNAIVYTDYVLNEVIELLKKNSNFETAMFYVSDHGKSLGEYGVYLHGLPYAMAPDVQKHVPAVMWLGEGIKQEVALDKLNDRSKHRWSHDNVFSTLLGLFEVSSEAYDERLDLIPHVTETAVVR